MEEEKAVRETTEKIRKSEAEGRPEKPKAAGYAEGIFCIVYLLFMVVITYKGFREYDCIADDEMLFRHSLRFGFAYMIGILAIIGLFNVMANAYTMPAYFYVIIILLIIFSFAFYLPVAIDGKRNPKLGMLMIPKTLCYMAMMGLIVFWPY
ncbi:MAG: hypothetical protein J6O17_07405 [Eubacterium sp.]|nr:hypothetical protein [Eubacterium sp.]